MDTGLLNYYKVFSIQTRHKSLLGDSLSLDDGQGAQNLFDQIWQLWLEPEIKRRLKDENKTTYEMPRAILIRFPPDEKHQVLFNKETKLIVKAKLTGKNRLKKHDPVYEDDISKYVEICQKPEVIQENDAYIIMLGHKKSWIISFDFRLRKGEMKKKYDKINEFIQTSKFALENKHYSAFVDNLFSASELIVDIILLFFLHAKKIKSHSSKIAQYKRIQKNDEEPFITVHNKLFGLRPDARYAKGVLQIDYQHAEKMLSVVEEKYGEIKEPVSSFTHFNGKIE